MRARYPARVTRLREDGTVDVAFVEDDECETGLPLGRIRPLQAARLGEESAARRVRMRERKIRLNAEDEAREARRVDAEARSARGVRMAAGQAKLGVTTKRKAGATDRKPGTGPPPTLRKRTRRALNPDAITATRMVDEVATKALTTFKVLTHGDCDTNRSCATHARHTTQPTHTAHTFPHHTCTHALTHSTPAGKSTRMA